MLKVVPINGPELLWLLKLVPLFPKDRRGAPDYPLLWRENGVLLCGVLLILLGRLLLPVGRYGRGVPSWYPLLFWGELFPL